jgi:hypothetical protein
MSFFFYTISVFVLALEGAENNFLLTREKGNKKCITSTKVWHSEQSSLSS